MKAFDLKKKNITNQASMIINSKDGDNNHQIQYSKILFYPNEILLEEDSNRTKNKDSKNYKNIPLDQSTKYKIIWKDNAVKVQNDIGVCLIHNNQQINLYLSKQDERARVRNFLASKINYMGFHQYFKTTGKIGQGSFASVYTTKKIQTGVVYAVKAIPKGETKQQQAIRLQIKILRKIEHQNIIKLRQVYETQNSLYLLFDQLEGPSLDSKISQDPDFFTNQKIKKSMEQLFRALAYLSGKGIFHRDIKLQNLKFKNKQCTQLILIDFGLADYASEKKYLFLRCGTPGYVAPEILTIKQGEYIDPICDVFSAGVIMYIMLSKKHLFSGKNDRQALHKNKNCVYDSTFPQLKNYPQKMVEFLKKCLEKKPSNRISSSQALNDEFFGTRKLSLTNITTTSDLSNQKQSADPYFFKNSECLDQSNKKYSKFLYFNTQNTGSRINTPRETEKEKKSKCIIEKLNSNPSFHILRRSVQSNQC